MEPVGEQSTMKNVLSTVVATHFMLHKQSRGKLFSIRELYYLKGHSPTQKHVCKRFHSREKGKYYPVHHPFHLKRNRESEHLES